MNALTKEQRTRHEAVTKRLLQHATCKDLAEGYLFTIDRAHVSVADMAEWVADRANADTESFVPWPTTYSSWILR